MWSRLSTAAVVNRFFLRRKGQITPLDSYSWATEMAISMDMSRTLSYGIDNPKCNKMSTSSRLRVRPCIIIPRDKSKGVSFHFLWCIPVDPLRLLTELLYYSGWAILIVACLDSSPSLLVMAGPSKIMLTSATSDLGTDASW